MVPDKPTQTQRVYVYDAPFSSELLYPLHTSVTVLEHFGQINVFILRLLYIFNRFKPIRVLVSMIPFTGYKPVLGSSSLYRLL